MVKDVDAKENKKGNQQTVLHLAAHATEDELDSSHKRHLVEVRVGLLNLFLFVVSESGEATRYAAHMSAEEALVLCRKGRVAVSHLGRLPGDRTDAVAAGRTGATAVHVEPWAGPATARDGRRAAGEGHWCIGRGGSCIASSTDNVSHEGCAGSQEATTWTSGQADRWDRGVQRCQGQLLLLRPGSLTTLEAQRHSDRHKREQASLASKLEREKWPGRAGDAARGAHGAIRCTVTGCGCAASWVKCCAQWHRLCRTLLAANADKAHRTIGGKACGHVGRARTAGETYRLWWAGTPRLPVAGVSRAGCRGGCCRVQEKGRQRSVAGGESEPAGRCRSSRSRRKALKEPGWRLDGAKRYVSRR